MSRLDEDLVSGEYVSFPDRFGGGGLITSICLLIFYFLTLIIFKGTNHAIELFSRYWLLISLLVLGVGFIIGSEVGREELINDE